MPVAETKRATKPVRIFEADHGPLRLIAQVEDRTAADVVHSALAEYLTSHRERLAEVFSATQRAIAAGDLEALVEIASRSVEAQVDAVMSDLDRLR
jgi:hypothetical protein